MIHGHGDDTYHYNNPIRHNFSTNIFSGFNHSKLSDRLNEVTSLIVNYPEPEPISVEKLIAALHGISPTSVIATNGATEAIYLIAHMLRSGASTIISPTFSEYESACKLHDHKITFTSGIYNSSLAGQYAVWLCNPNNPTGKAIPIHDLRRIIDTNPDTIFIVDQSYADYTLCKVLRLNEAVNHNNLIILGSLTKRFGIPGLRIGYAVSSPGLISRIRQFRMPWSVNTYAIEAAKYLLSNPDDYIINAQLLHEEALRMSREMRRLNISVTDTDCNFILCELPSGKTAAELKDFLAINHGILIRDASNFHGLTRRHFRVAAQTRIENDKLINAIKLWMSL